MYRVNPLLGGKLSQRNYITQVGETYAMTKALNKIAGLVCLEFSILHKNHSMSGNLVF